MTRNEQLSQLFDLWKQSREEYKVQFIRDGIIDEELFNRQQPKLLFITKEANGHADTEWDFRETWLTPQGFRFDKRIAEWAWGIQNNFRPFDEVYRKEERYAAAIRRIAFMDVKKSSGGAKCDHRTLLRNIEENLDYLHQQIDIIKPDVIISGLVDITVVSALFKDIKFVQSGYDRCVARWKEYKIIDFFHPSGQTPPSAMYCLLEKIYSSTPFQNL